MTEPSPQRVRRHLLVGFYVVALLWGLHSALTWQSQAIPLALGLLLAFEVANWCLADARVVGKPIPSSVGWLMFLFWPVAAPAYLMWTRRLRGVAMSLAHLLLFLLVANLTFFAVAYAVYGARVLRAAGP